MSKTHDYTKRYWGHDYTFDPLDEKGLTARILGWGKGICEADYILLENGDENTRYQATEILYFSDPPDMWKGIFKFAPRQGE